MIEMKLENSFGALLRKIRLDRGYSQRKLGLNYGRLRNKEDGVAPSVISAWESGSRGVTREVIAGLAQALHATPDEHNALLMAAGFMPEIGLPTPPFDPIELLERALHNDPRFDEEATARILEVVREVMQPNEAIPHERHGRSHVVEHGQ